MFNNANIHLNWLWQSGQYDLHVLYILNKNYKVCSQMTICLLITWPINQSWHCWESFETKDTKRCILERCFWKLKMMSKSWKQGQVFFWSWNSWEHFESNDDIWCSLVVFQMMFLKMELLRKLLNQGHKMVHSGAIWNDF